MKSILLAFEPQNFTKSWRLTKFTRFNWFQDINYYNLENFDQFGWKNWQKRKMAIFWYFTKLEITQVQNDLESWNLAKLWRIILSKIATQRFLIIWAFLKILPFLSKICPKFLKNGQILDENGKISKNSQIIKKRCVAILDNIMLHNFTKF